MIVSHLPETHIEPLTERCNVNLKNPILFKASVLHEFRSLLHSESFIELSTPVIRRMHGSEITPRIKLENGWYLRDSPAFALRYNLKFAEKIFEIGPCFRLNDISDIHLPEFTMLDLYWRGASLVDTVSLAKRLVQLFYQGQIVELSVAEFIQEAFGVDLFADEFGEQHLHQQLCARYSAPNTPYLVLFDKYIKNEIEPLSKGRCCVLWDFPLEAEARARRKEGTQRVADRVEFQIEGIEVIHAYSDTSDPSDLVTRAEAQNDLEPEDRIMADLLANELVPSESSGFGIGVDRLCQVCLGISKISEFMASKPFSIFDEQS